MSDTIQTDQPAPGVLRITLNRPDKKNAFNPEQWRALSSALEAANSDDGARAVIITGAGGDFSSGVDLGTFGEDSQAAFSLCQKSLFESEKPLIGAACGVAIGGGATALFLCDLLYVGESLRMRLPFASLGLAPELGSSHSLQQSIGYRRAAELFFTAQWIDAPLAVECGIANAAAPDEQVFDLALDKAKQIAQWPANSLSAIKRCLKRAHLPALREAAEKELAEMTKLAGTPENIEALTAFIEKRDPDFEKLREQSNR